MIDPKRLELGMYEDIPHLLTPVVVDPKQAANALRWAVREMEERYKTLAVAGRPQHRAVQPQRARHDRGARPAGATEEDVELLRPLPFIVVVIDELADLMMVAGNEVEESICRLAQMARAVGIHLILATQRPSVDVITGLIKANLPARISFRVSSKIDSRTILDANGAEQLLGKGDMLFLPPASSRVVRLHGPYISEQEIARLASFLRKQGKPVYNTTITEDEKSGPEAHRVREGRPLRRGRAHRRLERPGVDFVPAAPLADRVQPRRAARGHDGSRGPRLPGRGRQAARGARAQGLLRRGRCPVALTGHRGTTMRTLRLVLATALLLGLCVPADAARADRASYERAVERERALTARAKNQTPTDAEVRSVSLAFENVARRYPTSGYADNALLKAAALAEDLYARTGREADLEALRPAVSVAHQGIPDQHARQTGARVREVPREPAHERGDAPQDGAGQRRPRPGFGREEDDGRRRGRGVRAAEAHDGAAFGPARGGPAHARARR